MCSGASHSPSGLRRGPAYFGFVIDFREIWTHGYPFTPSFCCQAISVSAALLRTCTKSATPSFFNCSIASFGYPATITGTPAWLTSGPASAGYSSSELHSTTASAANLGCFRRLLRAFKAARNNLKSGATEEVGDETGARLAHFQIADLGQQEHRGLATGGRVTLGAQANRLEYFSAALGVPSAGVRLISGSIFSFRFGYWLVPRWCAGALRPRLPSRHATSSISSAINSAAFDEPALCFDLLEQLPGFARHGIREHFDVVGTRCRVCHAIEPRFFLQDDLRVARQLPAELVRLPVGFSNEPTASESQPPNAADIASVVARSMFT